MSIMIADINLSTIGSAFQITPPSNLQANQIDWISFLNESQYSLTLVAGGVNIPIPAWDEYPLQVSRSKQIILSGFSFPINMSSKIFGVLDSNLSTTLRTTFYTTGEVPSSTSPRSLVRQTWTPNKVNTVGGTANSIQNDGNIAGTQIIESTVSGDGSSSAILTNDAKLTLGTLTRAGSITLTGIATISDHIVCDIIEPFTGDHLNLKSQNGNTQVLIGDTQVAFNEQVAFTAGSITAISAFGPYTLNIAPALQNHNLGSVPDLILMVVVNGGGGTLGVVGYNDTTMTTTQASMFSSINGTFARGLAIKF